MSIETSSFVLGLSIGRGNGIRKLILLGYANHTDKHSRGAYPSTRTIADYAEGGASESLRHLGREIPDQARGAVTVAAPAVVDGMPGVRRVLR